MINNNLLHQVIQSLDHLKSTKSFYTDDEYHVQLLKLRVKLSEVLTVVPISKTQIDTIKSALKQHNISI